MLSKLRDIIDAHFSSSKFALKDVPTSCCITNTSEVYYFDKIKEDFFKGLKVTGFLKSVDALYFYDENTLFFIEMVSFQNYSTRTGDCDCKKFITNELDKDDLVNKIVDSLMILLGISGYYCIDKDFYGFFLDLNKLKVKTILLLDISYMQLTDLMFSSLHKRKISATKKIEGDIEVFNCKRFEDKFSTN